MANYAYLQQCYIPLFEVATKRCQFGSLAAIMFQQLKCVFRFHSWADFFSKSKNTSDPFKVVRNIQTGIFIHDCSNRHNYDINYYYFGAWPQA